MKKTKFLFAFLILIGGLAIYGFFSAVPGTGENESISNIEIYPSYFDFGTIDYGEVVDYVFIIKNSGKEVLEIRRVTTSCPCANAEVKKEIIQPGEEINLFVSYDSGAMGAHGRGKQERIIFVRSNDPVNPQVEVTIYAEVK